MFPHQPEPPRLTPIPDVLTMAILTCFRMPVPLVGAATAAALAANLIASLVNFADFAQQIAWALFIAALTLAFLAPTTLFVLCAIQRRRPTTATALGALVALGPRYFAIGLLLGLATLPLAVAPFVAPVLLYVVTRFSLAGPAVLIEDHRPLQALGRSWTLVSRRWWRTFALQLLLGVFAFLLLFGAEQLGNASGSAIVALLAASLAQGIAAPLLAAVEIILFIEYSGAAQPPPEQTSP